MDKRINCYICPLRNVETDVLCEDYCSDMADYREELRTETIEEFVISYIKDEGNEICKDCSRSDDYCCIQCFRDRYLEQLKKQNNQIIKDLAPKGCADMPKEIVCNCTKEQNK